MRSSKTRSEGARAGLRQRSAARFRPEHFRLNLSEGLRRRLRMALFIQQFFVCAASLLLALSCVRVEPAANGNSNANSAADGSPDAPLLSAAEPITLSPEDQTEDALNNVRRADETARAGGGGVPQLTPAEHMRRAAIYHANRAFEEARTHWRALIERYPTDGNVPAAHFGIGRTLFQERRYEEALPVFQQLGEKYPATRRRARRLLLRRRDAAAPQPARRRRRALQPSTSSASPTASASRTPTSTSSTRSARPAAPTRPCPGSTARARASKGRRRTWPRSSRDCAWPSRAATGTRPCARATS